MNPAGGGQHDVRRTSIRVALSATALVGAVYLLVAIGVVLIVTGNLTGQIDNRLSDALSHVPRDILASNNQRFEPPNDDRPFGPLLLTWTVQADGTLISGPGSPDLPAAYRGAVGPENVTIQGTVVRIQSAPAGAGHVIVGQTLDAVSQAQANVILAELLIGPGLLLVVFLGAIAIGRRVASPVEAARQRQLEFTADASHELRTPLAVIEANASLALSQPREADWYRAAFGRVNREAHRMHRLVDDLLWLARFDAGQAAPASEPVDLATLAAGATDRFAAVAEARGIRLELQAPETGLVVRAPADWLDRLLGVLIDNACKYSPEGGTVTVAVSREGTRARLTVDDTGPGIPVDQRPKIFDRFHRATSAANGAGLGLAIGDAVVRATGGRWLVGASPAGGARLAVSWPVA